MGGQKAKENLLEDFACRRRGTERWLGRFKTKIQLLLSVGGEVERSFGGDMLLGARLAKRKELHAEVSRRSRAFGGQIPFNLEVVLDCGQCLIKQASQHFLGSRLIPKLTGEAFKIRNEGPALFRGGSWRRREEQAHEEKCDHAGTLSAARTRSQGRDPRTIAKT